MALPKLETPKHRTELPTTKETVYFRPFLVGEQKQLLIAQESEDQNMVIREMIRLIDVCVDNVSSENLSTTDIEWLFLQIRIKSVGETADLILKCQDESCEADNEFELDLETAKVEQKEKLSNIIELTPKVSVELEYPSFAMMEKVNFGEDNNISTVETFNLIARCVTSVIEGEEIHSREDFTTKELIDFMDSMSVVMLEDIQKYFDSAPKLTAAVDYTCTVCGKNNNLIIEGSQNFFG